MHDSRIFMCWPNLNYCGLKSFWGLAVGVLADRVTRMELLASSG